MRDLYSELEALASGRWGPLAAGLVRVREQREWETTAKSFSDWLKQFSRRNDVSLSRCWRYLAAANYYQRLRALDESLLPLSELQQGISAEALEFVQKLERFVPKLEMEEVRTKVLNGQMPMRRLKSKWANYRRAYDENVYLIPETPPTTAERGELSGNSRQRLGAECLEALSENASWAGQDRPHRWIMMRDVVTENREFDAVVISQKSKSALPDVHVIDIMGISALTEARVDSHIPNPPQGADYLWAVIPKLLVQDAETGTKKYVGLVYLNEDKQPQTVRQAERLDTGMGAFERRLLLGALTNY